MQGQQHRRDKAGKRPWVRIAVFALAAVLLFTAAVAIGDERGGSGGVADERTPERTPVEALSEKQVRHDPVEPSSGGDAGWTSTRELVQHGEALPCTGPREPINFEIYSAGPEVLGLPMTATVRRCDTAAPAGESPANRITYMYGDCEIEQGATGCAPELEVQTWPACQRNLAGYAYEGKPLPYRELPRRGGAELVEIAFALESRIEVYTRSSTIVIFADTPVIARAAIEQLVPQEEGQPPITNPAALRSVSPKGLGAPSDGATEGKLPCKI